MAEEEEPTLEELQEQLKDEDKYVTSRISAK